jgi:5'-nucleotidase
MSKFTSRTRYILLVAAVLVLALGAVSVAGAIPPKIIDVQLLALNDFHGNLEPPSGSSGRIGSVNAGGVEYLATHIDQLRSTNPNTVVVSAGDMIGASPLLSALFHDEPTIEAFNLMGLDFNAVGNHEFDEGWRELLRMQSGGCHPVDGCLDGDGFAGANFKFLAANVINDATGRPIFDPVGIKVFNRARIGFIGMTLEGTPSIVTPSGVEGLTFKDEADTANALVPILKSRGVETIVVLIHEGGAQTGTYNQCVGISGAIVDIVNRLDPEIDVVISGHTHQAYNCNINGKLVTSAASFGRLVTDIDLKIDRLSGEVVQMAANNVIVTRDVPKASLLTELIAKYQAVAKPIADRVIGSITADITRAANAAGESALGDVIADAQLENTKPASEGGALVAFMNPGGIRADLVYNQISGSEQPGEVTYGEMFTVQPFGNNLVTLDLTGAQIDTLLEQQFDNPAVGQNRILQVSNGFSYTWSQSAPTGSKVDIASITINGAAIDPNATYRVTVNSFLADGGDNFSVLKQGTNRLGGAVDTDALEAYFKSFSPVAPGPQNRITVVP